MPAEPPTQGMSPWGWLVLALSFATAAAAVLAFNGGDVWHGFRSERWPHAVGEVLEADLTHYQGPKTGHTHSAWVRYRYTVDGRTFEAERVEFPPLRRPGPEEDLLARVQAAYPVGSMIDVFYDPVDPTRACLIPGIAPLLLWGLVAVVGATTAVAGWCGWRFIRGVDSAYRR